MQIITQGKSKFFPCTLKLSLKLNTQEMPHQKPQWLVEDKLSFVTNYHISNLLSTMEHEMSWQNKQWAKHIGTRVKCRSQAVLHNKHS